MEIRVPSKVEKVERCAVEEPASQVGKSACTLLEVESARCYLLRCRTQEMSVLITWLQEIGGALSTPR